MPTKTVERNIYFYRSHIGLDEGGQPLPFDPAPALRIIGSLPFTDGARYESDTDGSVLCVLPVPPSSNSRLQFCRIRRAGLPLLEQGGSIRELQIHPNAGLLEPTHVIFFPSNIVGVEYNHYGPRFPRLGPYLHNKSNQAISLVSFRRLVRGDIADQLDRLTELRLFEFKSRPSYAEVIRQTDESLADALDANGRVIDNPDVVQVVLRASRDGRRSALEKLRALMRFLLDRNDLGDNVEQFKVKGKTESGRVETLDLLSDHFVSTKKIVCISNRGRALDSDSAFQAIGEAYQELKPELERAASVWQ